MIKYLPVKCQRNNAQFSYEPGNPTCSVSGTNVTLFVHMGNFSQVDWDEIQETKPKWGHIKLYRSPLF